LNRLCAIPDAIKARCASALIGITALAVPGLLVEIEATAVVADAR
jgi:enamine deaminase RidA (YjgF/YER057c/UK114 family)